VQDVRFPDDAADAIYLVNGTTVTDDGTVDLLDGGRDHDFAPLGQDDGELTRVELAVAPILADVSAATFSDPLTIDNTYLPWRVGDRTVYLVEKVNDETGEIEVERIVVEVLDETRTIMGVETRSVRDRVFLNGLLIEDATDFYGQDDADNVWYFGEVVTDFEYDDEGNLIGTSSPGAWIAGENGALPGIIMFADPQVGTNHYQEFALLNDAIDQAVITALDAEVENDLGLFTDVLVSLEFTELEPDVMENKLLAPGLGLVQIQENLDENGVPGSIVKLLSFTAGSAP
jgi:hypothetical protein